MAAGEVRGRLLEDRRGETALRIEVDRWEKLPGALGTGRGVPCRVCRHDRLQSQRFANRGVACGPHDGVPDAGGTWVGNVTTVVNESGSVWGGTARLVEEMSIGADAGADEYMLGEIRWVTSDGERILVADTQVNAIRVYDLDGTDLFDIGGPGNGPGEFQEPKAVGVAADGTIFVQDDRAARISRFTSSGTYIDYWPKRAGGFYDGRFTVTPDGRIYIYEGVGARTDPDREFGMLRHGPDGATDELIKLPEFDVDTESGYVRYEIDGRVMGMAPVPLVPNVTTSFSSTVTPVGGYPETYRSEVLYGDGTLMVVENSREPAPADPAEFAWLRDNIAASFRERVPTWTWTGPEAPSHKPAYRSVFAADDGRVWVLREGPSHRVEDCAGADAGIDERRERPCWRPAYVFDVFDQEGRLLTSAAAPEATRPGRHAVPARDCGPPPAGPARAHAAPQASG